MTLDLKVFFQPQMAGEIVQNGYIRFFFEILGLKSYIMALISKYSMLHTVCISSELSQRPFGAFFGKSRPLVFEDYDHKNSKILRTPKKEVGIFACTHQFQR